MDWGLGHATRSIPVIQCLLDQGHEVMLASSGLALNLLREEYPLLRWFELPSYRAFYSRKLPFTLVISGQIPKFLQAIRQEHRRLEEIVRKENVQYVISDNRYGCYSKSVPSAMITHQVNILMPGYLMWAQGVVNNFNHQLLGKFQQCWVPDFPEDRITSVMTEPRGVPVRFIGMLSRMELNKSTLPAIDILGIVSGPEPQRTVFEQLLLRQLKRNPGARVLLRGTPGVPGEINADGVSVINHLKSAPLAELISRAEIVVCRSGYSSIMDLAAMNKKCILVPTPGQTEQELLAAELMRRGIAFSANQKDFDLATALAKSAGYTGFDGWTMRPNLLTQTLDAFLA